MKSISRKKASSARSARFKFSSKGSNDEAQKLSDTNVPGTTDPNELRKRYDSWADSAHARMKWEYVAHESAAQKLWHHFSDNDVRILCFGDNAALAKQALIDKDFRQVNTLTDNYELAAIKDNAYDAIVSVGTFIASNAPSAFAALARITKPGGFLVFTLPSGPKENQTILNKVNESWTFVESFGEHHLKDGKVSGKMYIYRM